MQKMYYLIITACVENKVGIKNDAARKARYIECVSNAARLLKHQADVKVVIVENNGKRETYLDDLGLDVVYTNNNSLDFPHKGGNELLDIKDVVKKYKVADEDFVIKLTGRYKLLNLGFINLVRLLGDEYDAFVKFFNVCTFRFHEEKDDCVLGLFAVKCKYIKAFTYGNNGDVSAESDFALFIRNAAKKVFAVKKLGLECCFAGDHSVLAV